MGLRLRSDLADLFVYDALGQLIALVDATAIRGTSPGWATEFRYNMMDHRRYPETRFFLIVTPDHVYLWKNVPPVAEMIPPTHVLDAGPLLAPYFSMLQTTPERVSRYTFHDVVEMWLSDLSERRPGAAVDRSTAWARETGFLEAIREGSVLYADAD